MGMSERRSEPNQRKTDTVGDERLDDFARSTSGWFWEMDAQLRFSYVSPNIKDITEAVNSIGNLQLLIARENREKSDQPFSHWVETRDEDFLERHCLPSNRALWSAARLPEFVRERNKLIAEKVRKESPSLVG